jgi:protein-S-isoprenylcysteine O-methyltransferase Ste14
MKLSMKSHIILGSILGFLVGAGFSLADQCTWATAVWRACVAALVAAILTRWWSRIFLQSLGDAIRQRRQASSNPPAKTKPVIKT